MRAVLAVTVLMACACVAWAGEPAAPGPAAIAAGMRDFERNVALGAILETRAGTSAELGELRLLADRGLKAAQDLAAKNPESADAQYLLGSWLLYGYRVVTVDQIAFDATRGARTETVNRIIQGLSDDPQPGLDEAGAHAIHQDKLSCYVCHSAGPVETCTGCHEGYDEEGTRFRTSDITYVFKIGTNPNPTERHPYEYVTVREVPTVPDTFEGFGVTLENYDAVPTWKMSTPHNIRKTTRYSRSCDSCHGHPELFLSEEDLGPDPSEADLSVVVPNPPE